MALDEWDLWEEEEELVHTCPPPPPPPPPPPAAAPPNQPADGISHMSMMAKSRMQQELVAKARLRQAISLPGVAKANSFTDINGEQATVDSVDFVPMKADAVHDKIKVLETRLEKDKFIPLPPISPTVAATEKATKGEETAVKQQLPPRRKLYDSLFDEKTLSEKERQRRQFLFGVSSPPSKTPVQPPENLPPPPCKPVAPPPPPKEKDDFPQAQNDKAVAKKNDEKKPKNKCCVIL
jgi:hypothetical protein